MAPMKFGLFKGRSREQPEPPSTENLLQSSCTDLVVYPPSPIPSTSNGLYEDHNGFQEFALLHLDSDDEDESEKLPVARRSSVCKSDEAQINYKLLHSTNTPSTATLQETLQDSQDLDDFKVPLDDIPKYELVSPDDATSIDAHSLQFDQSSIFSEDIKYCGATRKQKRNRINYKLLHSTNTPSTATLQETLQDSQDLDDFKVPLDDIPKYELVSPDDATSIDAHSLQFDQSSIFSEDIKYCGATRKQKRNRTKEEQKIQKQQNDCVMWQASNYEVLQRLLSRSGTIDEQIKWEAIATARGLCTLTATCSCGDCAGGKSPAAMTDGDGGMGAAPIIGAVSLGCVLQ